MGYYDSIGMPSQIGGWIDDGKDVRLVCKNTKGSVLYDRLISYKQNDKLWKEAKHCGCYFHVEEIGNKLISVLEGTKQDIDEALWWGDIKR